MRATFIGQDGSMGLVHGREYDIQIFLDGKYIYVRWGVFGLKYCPYSNLKRLQENWKLATEKGE